MKRQITKQEIWVALLERMEKEKEMVMLDFEKEAIADFLVEIGAELSIAEKARAFEPKVKLREERSEYFAEGKEEEIIKEMLVLLIELYKTELEELKIENEKLKKRRFYK